MSWGLIMNMMGINSCHIQKFLKGGLPVNRKLSKNKYIYSTVGWTIIAVIIYRVFFFSAISTNTFNLNMSNRASKVIFYGLVTVLTAIYSLINYKKSQVVDVLSNPLYAMVIYTMVSKLDFFKTAVLWFLSITLGLIVLIMLLKALFKPNRHFNISNMFRKVRMNLRHSKFICKYGEISLLITLIIAPLILGAPSVSNEINSNSYINSNSFDLYEYTDDLSIFESNLWTESTLEERLEATQKAVDIEIAELGVNHRVEVETSNLSEYTLGSYSYGEQSIEIDTEYLEKCSNREILDLICHECYHAYQHSLIESYNSVADDYKGLMIYRNVENYKYELLNYDELSEDFYSYYDLNLERDARNYAQNRVDYYLLLVREESENIIVAG